MSSNPPSLQEIEYGLNLSEQYLNTLSNLISSKIFDLFAEEIPGLKAIQNQIEAALAKAETTTQAAAKAITQQIETKLKGVIPDALSFLASIAGSLDSHLTQLLQNIATTEDVLATTIGTVRNHGHELAQWFHDNIAASLGNTVLNVLKVMEGQEAGGINAMLDEISKVEHLPPWYSEIVHTFRHRGAEWQALALPAILVGLLIGAIEALQEPFQVALRQQVFHEHPTKVTEPATLITLLNKGLIDSKYVYDEMRKSGFDVDPVSHMIAANQGQLAPSDVANMMFRGIIPHAQALAEIHHSGMPPQFGQWLLDLNQRLLPEDQIRSALLRKLRTDAEHDAMLKHWGYTQDSIHLAKQLYFYIPPVPDIIHMGIRNVFNPEIVQRFNLLGDYPQAFEDAAHQQGVSKEWAEKYWEAHWIVPSRGEAFEMFQRTTDTKLDPHADTITLSDGTQVHNIIGRNTLNLLLREVDTPPFYRDKVTAVAYRPYTRIDIRRLHKIGLLTLAGVERAYLDLGYDLERAKKLAIFTEKLNSTTTKNAAQSLVTSLQRKVIELYVADKLPLDQVHTTLTDLGFTRAEIAVFVAEADLVHESEYITALEQGVGKLYTAGIISDKEATKRLHAAHVPVDAMSTLFAKWDLAIQYRGGTEHILKHRELTKGEVLQALIDGLIDQPTAESMLEALGYDKNGADAEISLALYKSTTATKRTQIEAIKASFVNGVIEQLEASNRLDALFVPSEQRDAYLAEWSLARETRTERIPIATLRDMLKGNFISAVTTLTHLKRHRFTDDDAALLIAFWSAQPAPKGLKSVPSA